MKLFLLLLLLACTRLVVAYTYTVGQNLRWDESRALHAGESVLIPANTLARCDFQVLGPGVSIVNNGNWSPSQLALEYGAVLTNNGSLNAIFLDVVSGTFVNTGTAYFTDLPIRPGGVVRNRREIWLAGGQLTNQGQLQNCGTIRYSLYQKPPAPGGVILACGALPVQLLTFTAELALGTVRLQWTVAQEVNLAGYEVERSVDGVQFGYLSRVTATGARAYAAPDQVRVGPQYYRLRLVDTDATFTYSPVAFLAGPQLVSRAWYNELGQRLGAPRPGFLIEVSIYNNGAVESRKYLQE
jgi:hypothetical protein